MTFEDFWQQAIRHHGTAQIIESLLPTPVNNAVLMERTDAEYLSLLTRRVFRAGMKHSVVDSRWAAFEKAFWHFNPQACQLISDELFDQHMQNSELIRHWRKMKTIPINATMVLDAAQEHGSFGHFLSQWPTHDIVGLWQYVKKHGAHLGGDGGARFLRMAGKDTFVLSEDVTRALINANVVTKKPTSLRDLATVQHYFNDLADESKRPLCEISMVMALSIGPRH
ncbi:DNA-3-methyladenine glycosylase I [Reinekea forsetii]|nr:DNA-3-methyladenine glycosylase I [Reinekea forsetii]